jgi:AraC family transcriptional regulator
MSQLEAMIQAVDFIETNLQETIQVADIADAVSYSLYHFCRTFNSLVHHTPYDYLIRRRLSESARELAATDRKIIDVAFDYRFNNPETFSRAFKRMFGMQPNQWKKQQQSQLDVLAFNRNSLLSRLTAAHIYHINKGDYLHPKLVEKDAFVVAGLMCLVDDYPADIVRLGSLLRQLLESAGYRTESRVFYGITTYPNPFGSFHLIGIEVDPIIPDTLPSELVIKSIPAQRYARFIHKGPYQDFPLTRDYVYQTWLPQSNQQISMPLEIVCYGPQAALQIERSGSSTAEWPVYLPIH